MLFLMFYYSFKLNDNKTFTDIGFIADLPKACLIDSIGSEIPADFKQMFDMSLCALSNRLLKDVISAYQQLNVKYEALRIIKPQFEIPLPGLQLAVSKNNSTSTTVTKTKILKNQLKFNYDFKTQKRLLHKEKYFQNNLLKMRVKKITVKITLNVVIFNH